MGVVEPRSLPVPFHRIDYLQRVSLISLPKQRTLYRVRKLKYYIKNPITYYSYGYIKIYENKKKKNEKYVNLIKYAYVHNIEIESYENIDDLINDLNEKEEYMIISDESKLENIKKLEKLENNKNKLIDLNEIKENYIFRLE